MTVDEEPFIQKCPKCGDTRLENQVPISLGMPPQCGRCEVNPWRDKPGYALILFYKCMLCKIRYLTPKLEKEELEYRMFSYDG